MFAEVALTYRRLGYSPLPIVPGTKRPALRAWSEHCKLPLGAARISALSCQMPRAGIGVALGFNGVVGIDVDTEDSAIIAAICAVLPAPAVVKIGARGWTAFYRAPGVAFIPSRRIPGIVEVLGSGTCTILPPSPHPHGFPYRWWTGETLDRVPVGELPEVPTDIADRLAAALRPWMPVKREPADLTMRRAAEPPVGLERRRYHAYACAGLARHCAALAATSTGGRNRALFALAAGLGRFVHHGVLPARALADAALAACRRNGFLDEAGQPACIAIIRNGLRFAEGDGLPQLADRRAA